MKYLCLVYLEPDKLRVVPDSECMASVAGMSQRGALVAAEALEPVETATTLRIRGGEVRVTDGPFAETKEQLAGFYLIDAANLDEALALAAKIPPAREGSVEVRPVRQLQP
ncbi:MAG: YciI family protein [Vicinamibacterales bacterium]